MRVSVIINSQAGSVNEELIQEKIRKALFRCDLRFLVPRSLADTERFAAEEIGVSDVVMICGGDGTINVTLQSLLRQANGRELPPIAVIRSGTANDLALEIGVSQKIEKAARAILEGSTKKIDLIELEDQDGQKAYMITNGGLGVTAMSIDYANRLRGTLRSFSGHPKVSSPLKALARSGYSLIKKLGPTVYPLMVAEAIRRWDASDWQVDIEMPNGKTVSTKAPGILVNNQSTLGADLMSAPYTSNNDGVVNLLITDTKHVLDQIRVPWSMRQGTIEELPFVQSYELKEFKFKSREGARSLTFAGDGEILIQDAREITVRCLHQKLSVVVRA